MADPTFPQALETPRLELRVYREQDAEALLRLVEPDRQRLRRNFHDTVDRLTTAAEARTFILEAAAQREARKVFIYGIWTRQAPALIGQLKVKNISWDVPAGELSYLVGSAYHRRGYATEAVLAALREAFERLQFNRIYARVIPSNHESLQLAHKLGMSHEGLHRKEFRCGYGELHDVHYFSITGDEYTSIRSKFRATL